MSEEIYVSTDVEADDARYPERVLAEVCACCAGLLGDEGGAA